MLEGGADRGNAIGAKDHQKTHPVTTSEDPTTREADAAARPANWPVPVLLICLRQWNSYGYELMERASAFGFGSLNAPTTYRTLRRMESDGVIESSWSDSGDGPARRVYSITDAGLAYLDLWVEYLENYRRTMDAFLRLYAGYTTGYPYDRGEP